MSYVQVTFGYNIFVIIYILRENFVSLKGNVSDRVVYLKNSHAFLVFKLPNRG